jgi:hypothetical protein
VEQNILVLEKLIVAQIVKKFPYMLARNPNIRYPVYNVPPLVLVLSQMNPVHALPSCSVYVSHLLHYLLHGARHYLKS